MLEAVFNYLSQFSTNINVQDNTKIENVINGVMPKVINLMWKTLLNNPTFDMCQDELINSENCFSEDRIAKITDIASAALKKYASECSSDLNLGPISEESLISYKEHLEKEIKAILISDSYRIRIQMSLKINPELLLQSRQSIPANIQAVIITRENSTAASTLRSIQEIQKRELSKNELAIQEISELMSSFLKGQTTLSK